MHLSLYCVRCSPFMRLNFSLVHYFPLRYICQGQNVLQVYIPLFVYNTYCRCPDTGSGSQLVNAVCFLVPNDDTRGNTVTHGFILVPVAGPYVQQRGVRGHCIILHPECL